MQKTTLFFLAVVIILCSVIPAFSQPELLWTRQVSSDSTAAYLYDITELSNGGFAAVGGSDSAGVRGVLLSRLSSTGQVVWANRYSFSTTWSQIPAEGYAITQLDNNTLRVVGQSQSYSYMMILDVGMDGSVVNSALYTGTAQCKIQDITPLDDGTTAVVGYMPPPGQTTPDLWLAKIGTACDTVWTERIGGTRADYGNQIKRSPSGGMVMSGYTTVSDADIDFWMVCTNADGNAIWNHTYGSLQVEQSFGMAVNASSEYYVAGYRQMSASNRDAYLIKVNASGQMLWGQTYTANIAYEQFRAATARNDGGVLCVGWAGTSAATSSDRFWVASISSSGQMLQSWVFGDPGSLLYGVTSVSTGGYIACGQVLTANGPRGYVIRIAALSGIRGTVQDSVSSSPETGVSVGVLGSAYAAPVNGAGIYQLDLAPGTYDLEVFGPCITTDTLPGVVVLQDSTVTANISVNSPHYVGWRSSFNVVTHNHVTGADSGYVRNTGHGVMDLVITPRALRPSSDWIDVSPRVARVLPGDSVQVVVTVHSDTTDAGVYDYLGQVDIRTHSCPDTLVTLPVYVTVLDAKGQESTPGTFELFPAYPNPFNAATVISFAIPVSSHVRLSVYDLLGRETAVIANRNFEAGRHAMTFDAGSLPSGVYFYRVQAGAYSDIKKMMLLK
jgi:hypothetical protein